MQGTRSYLQDIEHGVSVFKTHFQEIKAFADRYESRATALVHAATVAVPESADIHKHGLRDAANLIERVGRENVWLLTAVISAYSGVG
ncbi:MAG TPA: hypothetical protein VFE17_08055 [Candidatus Baltobacteraceae bacterium]|jgi:hypothetical protein|nr:hypothetical protein [Candidatus Baltobacteraceae bacterium]